MSVIVADTFRTRVAGAAVTTTKGLNVGGATTVAGGGLGGAATKAVATKYVTKKLIQNGAKPKVASRAARMAV